uniref:Uncharacterized LOC115398651 n=1 Tax=Salarias fasciatus TaxID=181472 RepID=A0A672J927_SALFA
MPLFRVLDECCLAKAGRRRKRKRNVEWMKTSRRPDEDGSVLSLTRLCMLSVADNMKEVWVKDYADKYLDQYSFRHIMGPFNLLPGDLVEELMLLLCSRKELSRAALHLLLVPQLRSLSLESCPGLVTPALCGHISARCQGLLNLDLSGAQQLSVKVLCETLHSLSNLHWLCLAGIPCDRFVIKTITLCCRLLRHLDVSRCHLLSPSALLPLGGGPCCPSSPSPNGSSSHCTSPSQSSISSPSSSSALSPLPLRSLLALDIGFEEKEGDSVAAAAYLLLSLPSLERLALEGLTQACSLIEQKQFWQVEEFTSREGVPRLEDLWRDRSKQQANGWKQMRTRDRKEVEDEEEEGSGFWEESGSESEENVRDKELVSSEDQTEEKLSSRSDLILQLRDVRGLTCDSLDSFARVCPSISSLSVNVTDDDESVGGQKQSSVLAAGLQSYTGQMRSLSVQFPGTLTDLFPALKVSGPSLVSLTLEGVKTSTDTRLLEVITMCHRLRELAISAEPPTIARGTHDRERIHDDGNLPKLPHLSSLSINFSYEHNQPKPHMSWMSLKRVLWCLLNGSPLLQKVSLVSLPCPLDSVLLRVLQVSDPAGSPPLPLARLQHINLLRTDVTMLTLKKLIDRSKNLMLAAAGISVSMSGGP